MAELTEQPLDEEVAIKSQQDQQYETGTNRISARRMWEIAAHMCRRYL